MLCVRRRGILSRHRRDICRSRCLRLITEKESCREKPENMIKSQDGVPVFYRRLGVVGCRWWFDDCRTRDLTFQTPRTNMERPWAGRVVANRSQYFRQTSYKKGTWCVVRYVIRTDKANYFEVPASSFWVQRGQERHMLNFGKADSLYASYDASGMMDNRTREVEQLIRWQHFRGNGVFELQIKRFQTSRRTYI